MFSTRSVLADDGSGRNMFVRVLNSVQKAILKRTIRPPFTLLSTTPRNPIIKQREFRHRSCIPSYLADLQIKDPIVLLAKLNKILGTHYSFRSKPALKDVMLDCISRGYDLGMAYGMLRRWWDYLPPDLLSRFESLENKDRERREAAVVDGLIKDVRMPPRRVWDLYSNRVLPFWAANSWGPSFYDGTYDKDIAAISHAWMSSGQRVDKDTPINGHQWPVPIPRDIDLDSLRIELLNFPARRTVYAWLDVLCLRQKGGPLEEQLLAKEWKIDVPTIGTIYEHCVSTVYYLNGLGRPFEENNLDDARHWCNRAWTVQEWCCGEAGPFRRRILGGITEQSPRFELSRRFIRGYSYFTKQLEVRMNGPDASKDNIIKAAAMMSKRQAERDVDRLAGLAYLACGETQPVFDAKKPVDDAWLPFIDCMTPEKRGQLFFLFPITGDRDYEWAPSWSQLVSKAEELVKNSPLLSWHGFFEDDFCPTLSIKQGEDPKYQNSKDGYSCLVICLPNCRLVGFDNHEFTSEDASGRKTRRGTVSFYVRRDCKMSFYLIACHSHPIPSGRYCLLATRNREAWVLRDVYTLCYWVVGWLDEEERFHKLSVLEIENEQALEYGTVVVRHVLNEKLAEELSLPIGGYGPLDVDSNPWVRRVKLA